jgi:hypothetical protein
MTKKRDTQGPCPDLRGTCIKAPYRNDTGRTLGVVPHPSGLVWMRFPRLRSNNRGPSGDQFRKLGGCLSRPGRKSGGPRPEVDLYLSPHRVFAFGILRIAGIQNRKGPANWP